MRAACFHRAFVLEKLIHAFAASKVIHFPIMAGNASGNRAWQAQYRLVSVHNPHFQEMIDLSGLLSQSCKLAIAKWEAGLATQLHTFCSSGNSNPGSTSVAQLARTRPAVESNGFQLYVHTEPWSTWRCQVLIKSSSTFPVLPDLQLPSLQGWHLIYQV